MSLFCLCVCVTFMGSQSFIDLVCFICFNKCCNFFDCNHIFALRSATRALQRLPLCKQRSPCDCYLLHLEELSTAVLPGYTDTWELEPPGASRLENSGYLYERALKRRSEALFPTLVDHSDTESHTSSSETSRFPVSQQSPARLHSSDPSP